ncbi:hypothetical protein DERP_008118 [Dermatophagoides pteronyssinus]|uniref:Uncharacterized protein n=1 Tax=Dermatophagoides pteronyssinus TaxID=6956 RepID=A0ABQ8JJR8_DERPT|nr:hypothetical protein DERP_008118 [Dermatophagoides pteronyssinus]
MTVQRISEIEKRYDTFIQCYDDVKTYVLQFEIFNDDITCFIARAICIHLAIADVIVNFII